jgi:hypothetical protein
MFGMDKTIAKLKALLEGFAERHAKAPPEARPRDFGEQQRRACGNALKSVVLPVLDALMVELQHAGHDASTRDHTDKENAYPSVALSFTPRAPGQAPDKGAGALASALIFRCDPRLGVVAQADVKPSPVKGQVPAGGGGVERVGTIGVDALGTAWVATKALNFIEAVLKTN